MKKGYATPPRIGIGYRIGKIMVEASTEGRKNGYTVWRCRCDCGGELLLDTRKLQRGTVRDCGCITNVKPGIKDLTGQTFGYLTALRPTEKRRRSGGVVWLCWCELCGKETEASTHELLTGNTKSCGNHAKTAVDEGLTEGTSIRKLEYYRTQKFPLTRSGYTGVYQKKDSGKWVANMKFQGKRILYKEFNRKEDAIKARKEAEKQVDAFLEYFYAEHPDWDRYYYASRK